MPLVEVKQLSYRYPDGNLALDQIGFQIRSRRVRRACRAQRSGQVDAALASERVVARRARPAGQLAGRRAGQGDRDQRRGREGRRPGRSRAEPGHDPPPGWTGFPGSRRSAFLPDGGRGSGLRAVEPRLAARGNRMPRSRFAGGRWSGWLRTTVAAPLESSANASAFAWRACSLASRICWPSTSRPRTSTLEPGGN